MYYMPEGEIASLEKQAGFIDNEINTAELKGNFLLYSMDGKLLKKQLNLNKAFITKPILVAGLKNFKFKDKVSLLVSELTYADYYAAPGAPHDLPQPGCADFFMCYTVNDQVTAIGFMGRRCGALAMLEMEGDVPDGALMRLVRSGGDEGGASNSGISNRDIHNKTTDPCISKTVDAALKANKDIVGVMADIIKKFDVSKSVDINIYDGHIYYKDQYGNNDISRPKPGQTTNQQFRGNSFSADITLGIDYHDGTSKENLVSSMIHEIVHAYLGYTSNNFLKTETDHNVIAEKYITPMAHYLNASFGVQMTDAYALAWSGVSDSKVFNKDTPNDIEFTVVYGGSIPNGKITVGDINRIAGAYKLSTKIQENIGYTRGSKICD